MEIDKTDGLITPNGWHNVRAFYLYAGTPENPQLIVDFELEISAYEPPGELPDTPRRMTAGIPAWQQKAIDDKQRFTGIKFQLNRNYEGADTPAPPGPAVSMFLTDSLLKTEKTPLSPEDAQSFRDFIGDSLVYVTKRADGSDGGAQPVCRLQIPVSPGDISDFDLIKLSLALSFETPEIADQESAIDSPEEAPDERIECDIEDLILSPRDISGFAAAFESIFFHPDWRMRLGTAAVDSSKTDEAPTADLWAVRTGRKPGAGYYYKIENQADFFAPQPIAETPQTGTVSIGRYSTGQPFPAGKSIMTFTNVDLFIWANEAFSAIEEFLSSVPPKVNRFLPDNTEINLSLDKIRQHKQTIARAIAGTAIPIFSTGTGDEISLAAAREKLRQSLFEQLSNAFTAAAITVLKASGVAVARHKLYGTKPPRFYGQLLANESQPEKPAAENLTVDEARENYFLGTGKIQYFKSSDEKSGGWRLPFLFSTENAGRQTSMAIPLAFRLTHLEYPLINAPEVPESEQSTWIRFVNEASVSPIGNIEFPVILRELPAPPITIRQTADSNVESESSQSLTPSDLAIWNYSLSCGHQSSAQDSLKAGIALNQQQVPASSQNALHPLFAPLAQFVTVFKDILSGFETAIGEIKTSNKINAGVAGATSAVQAFEQIVEPVAGGFNQWVNSSPEAGFVNLLPVATRSFEIVLQCGENGNARIDVINSISASEIPPVIEIESYKAVAATAKPDYALVSYNYILSESREAIDDEKEMPKTYLSYETALNIAERTIILKGLNVFTTQNARGQTRVIRNEALESGKADRINDSFKFLSAPVNFAEPVTPALRFTDYDLGRLEVASPTLENFLNAFFGSLLKEAAGVSLFLKITVSFSFALAPSPSDSERAGLPVAVLPVEIVVPQTGEPLPFVSKLADAITEWTKLNQPATDSSAEYNIRLEIFGKEINGQATGKPLLAIDNLFIRTGKIISG